MFKWYERAKVCYAHLADLAPGVSEADGFSNCRWFTRGWTLQELLAPKDLVFYDASWGRRSTKFALVDAISAVTGIDLKIIRDPNLIKTGEVCVAVKMSSASSRVTTRVEDIAYCLLGLFDINMPMLYGEGPRAFMRLQEEIMKRSNDLSLLAWKSDSDHWLSPFVNNGHACTGVLAPTPTVFKNDSYTGSYTALKAADDFRMTNKGINITTNLKVVSARYVVPRHYVLQVAYNHLGSKVHLILHKGGPGLYFRDSRINGGLYNGCESELRGVYRERLLPPETLYLSQEPDRCLSLEKMHDDALEGIQLVFDGDSPLQIYRVMPQGVLDAARGIVLDISLPVALHLGHYESLYGTTYLVIVNGADRCCMYLMENDALAMPYILSNLHALTHRHFEGLDVFPFLRCRPHLPEHIPQFGSLPVRSNEDQEPGIVHSTARTVDGLTVDFTIELMTIPLLSRSSGHGVRFTLTICSS